MPQGTAGVHPAIFVKGDRINHQLWEIDENLIRAELSPTEQAAHLAKRRELWGELQSAQVAPIEMLHSLARYTLHPPSSLLLPKPFSRRGRSLIRYEQFRPGQPIPQILHGFLLPFELLAKHFCLKCQ